MQESGSHRAFWLLAGPMIVGNISIALLGFVDTAVIGHLDSAHYLGGVAVGSVIFDFLFWGMGFLRMATTGVTARAHGEEDATAIRTLLAQSVLVAFCVALIILILQVPLFDTGLTLLEGSAAVKHHAFIYCQWLIWGSPALIILFSVNGWFLGMQNAIAVLAVGITINFINIILDIVFVVYMDMDVRGVALASVIAQYCGLVLALTIVARELKKYPGEWLRFRIFNINKLKQFLALNNDIFIRTICLILVFAFFTREGARQGDIILAANSVLMKFYLLMALALDGFNHAAEALVGKAIGLRSRALFKQAVLLTLKWSLLLGVFFSAVFWLSGEYLIMLMTDISPVIQAALVYLPWMVLLPVISVWCFLLDGVFIGAARGTEMRNAMLICTFVFFLPVWYLFLSMGNHGLWLAFTVFMVIRGISLGVYYYLIENNDGFVGNLNLPER